MDEEALKNLTQLSRIHCTKEEEESLLKDMQSILGYVAQLEQVDTEHVPPCNHVLEEVSNVTRDDTVAEVMPRQTFLENAPDQIGGMIRVPPVIKRH